MPNEIMRRIVRAYDRPLARLYGTIRFWILRERLLEQIEQYLPSQGAGLDVGCGLGLFTLYFAARNPGLQLKGIDRDSGRIAAAKRAAAALGIENVSFEVVDLRDGLRASELSVAYLIDIIHHIPTETVRPLVDRLREGIRPGGRLLFKEIARRPAFKRWFTFLLDKAMAPRDAVHYWEPEQLRALLEAAGLRVTARPMNDFLPYPHVLYVCEQNR